MNKLARVLIINWNMFVVFSRKRSCLVGSGSLGGMAVQFLCEYCTELTPSSVLKSLSPAIPDWSLWSGGELSHQDPLWGSGGGVPGHGGPSALCRPLVPADHQIPAALLQHHSHQVRGQLLMLPSKTLPAWCVPRCFQPRQAPELLPAPHFTAEQGWEWKWSYCSLIRIALLFLLNLFNLLTHSLAQAMDQPFKFPSLSVWSAWLLW